MLFLLAPPVMTAVAVIGAATLLIAGFSALVQHDLKRVLAYSTISQIGYMFLALGVGAWSAAMFHFMTHAFFKALLFLAAGAVIHALHHEHDMFKMGGLRKRLPLVFWTFVAGAASLAALPLVTSGFYSKDLILWSAWSDGASAAVGRGHCGCTHHRALHRPHGLRDLLRRSEDARRPRSWQAHDVPLSCWRFSRRSRDLSKRRTRSAMSRCSRSC